MHTPSDEETNMKNQEADAAKESDRIKDHQEDTSNDTFLDRLISESDEIAPIILQHSICKGRRQFDSADDLTDKE